MDCPGTVSMTVTKNLVGSSETILVDSSEAVALPEKVRDAYRRKGGAMPFVVFTDAKADEIYGTFNHVDLKKQDYSKIFTEVTAKVKTAIKDGSFANGTAEKVAIKDTVLADWESAAGSQIKARLVAVIGKDRFVFQTEAGKEIQVTADQLTADSAKKARDLAGL